MQHLIAGATHAQQSLPSGVKQAKVIAVHRDDHTVDVAFMDGSTVRRVPVLSGWLGSNHGAVGLTAPTYDPHVLAKKTYPNVAGDTVQPPANPSNVGRDQYAAVLQMEGHGFGSAGYVVLGFFSAQVSEMLFPAGEGNEFTDMLLVRHPSDVQTTIDKNGKVSIQHPTGTRITIGTGAVNLTKKDYDERYEIRHNKEALTDIEAVTMGQSEIEASLLLKTNGKADLYGKREVNIHTKAATHIILNEDTGSIDIFADNLVTLHTSGGATITLQGGNITISAPGTVAVSGATITLN